MPRRLAQEANLLVDVLEFLDECSLHNVRLASNATNFLVEKEIRRLRMPNLEIVQLKDDNGGIQCRCLPKVGKSKSHFAANMSDAARWLAPLIHNSNIRLFSVIQVSLCELTALNLASSLPARIDQLSMIGVSLLNISPNSFNNLVCVPLKAKKYAFTGMKDVASGHFSGTLLESDSFMDGEVVDIDVLSFQQLALPCISMFEVAVLKWFFEGPANKSRCLISNRMCLGPFMVSEMIDRFMHEETRRPAQLVLCGRIQQCVASFQHLLTSVRGRLAITLENKKTDEELVVIMLPSDDKMEISRHPIAKFKGGRLRPLGQSLR